MPYSGGDVGPPGQIVGHSHAQKLEVGHPLYLLLSDKEWRVAEVSGPAEIDDHFHGLGGVENQVVITAPLYQSLGFPPVCGLVICCDEAKYCCVVSKFYYEVRWRRGAVAVCEKCEEKWAEDATLRGPGVHGQGGGDVLANPDILCEVC